MAKYRASGLAQNSYASAAAMASGAPAASNVQQYAVVYGDNVAENGFYRSNGVSWDKLSNDPGSPAALWLASTVSYYDTTEVLAATAGTVSAIGSTGVSIVPSLTNQGQLDYCFSTDQTTGISFADYNIALGPQPLFIKKVFNGGVTKVLGKFVLSFGGAGYSPERIGIYGVNADGSREQLTISSAYDTTVPAGIDNVSNNELFRAIVAATSYTVTVETSNTKAYAGYGYSIAKRIFDSTVNYINVGNMKGYGIVAKTTANQVNVLGTTAGTSAMMAFDGSSWSNILSYYDQAHWTPGALFNNVPRDGQYLYLADGTGANSTKTRFTALKKFSGGVTKTLTDIAYSWSAPANDTTQAKVFSILGVKADDNSPTAPSFDELPIESVSLDQCTSFSVTYNGPRTQATITVTGAINAEGNMLRIRLRNQNTAYSGYGMTIYTNMIGQSSGAYFAFSEILGYDARTLAADVSYPNAINKILGAMVGVTVASTANIGALAGYQAVDGVLLVEGDTVLVKNQTNQVDNGVYVVTQSTWPRRQDFGGGATAFGRSVAVARGTTQAGALFVVRNVASQSTIGVHGLSFGRVRTALSTRTITASGAATSADEWLRVNGSAAVALSMPDLTTCVDGQQLSIKDIGTAGTYNITISPYAGQNINPSSGQSNQFVMNVDKECTTWVANLATLTWEFKS